MALAYRQLARMDGAAREALSMQARQVRGMLEDL